MADNDCVRLLDPDMAPGGRDGGGVREDGESVEFKELFDDMAVPRAPTPRLEGLTEYVRPRRKGGGSYVTPNSGCWQ